jgi:hypothetical protein
MAKSINWLDGLKAIGKRIMAKLAIKKKKKTPKKKGAVNTDHIKAEADRRKRQQKAIEEANK